MENFEALVNNLMSMVAEVRQPAEEIFAQGKAQQPDSLSLSLLALIQQASSSTIRSMSAILLRGALVRGKTAIWATLKPETREVLKRDLLQALINEKDDKTRKKICNTVSEVAFVVLTEGQWEALLPWLFNASKSANVGERESALAIFAQIASFLTDQLKPYLNHLKDILVQALTEQAYPPIRLAGLSALTSFVLSMEQQKKTLEDLIPYTLETIPFFINMNKEKEARECLEMLIELVEQEPTFFRTQYTNIVQAMLQIATSSSLDAGTRHLGLEFVVTLAEKGKSRLIKKIPGFVENTLPIILHMTTLLEDDPSFYQTGEYENEDEESDSLMAEEVIDRLAIAIGGEKLVPKLFELLPAMLSSPEWNKRAAALTVISLIGEGCKVTLLPSLPNLVQMLVGISGDAHARVKVSLVDAIAQFCTDYAPHIQTQYHAQILPILAAYMDDPTPVVQSHSSLALVNFCDPLEPEALLPYADPLLGKLALLLQTNNKLIMESSLPAVAAIADCLKGHFTRYYETFMPFLKAVLNNAMTKEFRKLRSKAMECVSLIAVAVGKEKFSTDAPEIMTQLVNTQLAQLDADDPQIQMLAQVWARMCKCLGSDFVPYLPTVLEPLMQSAKLSPGLRVADEEEQEPEGWDFVIIEGKKIGIKTSALEEKANAVKMLYYYAGELAEGFFPFVTPITELFLPLLTFYYHDDVRELATEMMPALITCVQLHNQKTQNEDKTYLNNLWSVIFPKLLHAVENELAPELLSTMVGTVHECMDQMGPNCLDDAQLKLLVNTLQTLLADHDEKYDANRLAKENALNAEEPEDEIGDPEDEAEEKQKEDDLIGEIAETVACMARNHKGKSVEYFKVLLPNVQRLLEEGRDNHDKQMAICMFDDIVENSEGAAVELFPVFLPQLIVSAIDPDAGVRQAAVFGLGVCAQTPSDIFPRYVPEIAKNLFSVVTAAEARSEANVHATENAISAIGKIIKYYPQAATPEQTVPFFLGLLPVNQDKIEAKVIHAQLMFFLETYPALVLGANWMHLGRLLRVIAECLGLADLITEQTKEKMIALLPQLAQQVPANVLSQAFSSLPPVERDVIFQYSQGTVGTKQ